MSYWEMFRKWRDKPAARPLRSGLTLAAEVAAIILLAVTVVQGMTRLNTVPKVAPPALEDVAWERACTLAKVLPTEQIPRPPTAVYQILRMDLVDPIYCEGTLESGQTCLARICGITEVFLTRNAAGKFDWTTNSTVYLLPTEGALMIPIMTHEYLHTIWVYRTQKDIKFLMKFPDSEAWVDSLVPAQCPAP